MSYSGTVHCGHCYQEGHNRRSCPKLKEYCENNPDSWTAKRQAQSAARGKVRRCSYCNLKGHNRRSCVTLKSDKATYATKAAEWRADFAEWVAEIGLTPGALIKVQGQYGYGGGVRIVSGFRWTALNHEMQQDQYPHQAIMTRELADPAGLSYSSNNVERLPKHDKLVPHNESQACEVVGPVYATAEAVLATAPEWFADGGTPSNLNDVFDSDRRANGWYENGYEG